MKSLLRAFIILLTFLFSATQIYSQNYCQPTSNCVLGTIVGFSTNGADQDISNLSSGCSNSSGFHYFYNHLLKSSPGDSIFFQIEPSAVNWYIGYAIWIDWNFDGDFTDTGEDVWNSATYVQGNAVDTIIIPSNMSIGVKRMRVRSSYYSMPTTPCANINWGETEDYPIVLTLDSGTDMSLDELLSPNVFSIGNNTIKVRLRNNGASTITSFDLGYQLNNNTPTLLYSINSSLSSGSSLNYQFPNPLYIPAPGNYSLKIWVASPNSISPDSFPSNDTMIINFCTGMSGTYTIGGGTADYSSINAAIQAMQSCGIADSVIFEIKPGTYTGQITVPEITGLSSSSTITFDGLNNTLVTLSQSVSSNSSGVIVIDETDYITFKNIKISNTATTGNAVFLKGDADHNTIENCKISAANYGLTSSLANYTLIKNNIFQGGNTAIYMIGPTSRCVYNKIIKNTLNGQKQYGIYLRYQRLPLLQYNKILNQGSNSIYGIYGYYNSGSQIEGNIINANKVGLHLLRENYITSDSGLVVNNIIGNFKSTTEQTGMSFDFAWNMRIFHNTVVVNSTGIQDSSHVALFLNYPVGVIVKNNILYNSGTNMLLSIRGIGYSGYVPCELDYNLYYSTSNAVKFHNNGNNYTDLASFKNSTNFLTLPHDDNSYYQNNPNFISSTDFHISPNYLPYNGTNLGVLYDVDGDSRCIYAHTIGADESSFNSGKPTAGFSVEDTLCVNSPIGFINHASANAPLGHEWYLNSVFQTNKLNFSHTFLYVPAWDTVMLITKSCGGVDTFTKVVYIDSPQVKPIAGFLADNNIVNPFDEVQFYSMSAKCPSTWEWKITPEYYYDPYLGQQPTHYYMNFTTKYSQNPKVKFEYPGKYTVCLITSNAVGSDTLCQQDYIYVIPVQYLCQYALPEIQNSTQGILYDDGGPSSDYANGNGIICDFKLTPCTDTLYFTFSEFEVSAGDFLRVYDGTDNQGTPLWDVTSYGANGLTGDMSNTAFDTVLISYSGNMYFEWLANNVGTNKGFIGEWHGSPSIEPKPIAAFSCPDTVCLGVPLTFQNQSTGSNLRYAWNFDGSGFIQSINENPEYTFTTSGIMPVTLTVLNCGGDSSIVKNVFVIGGSTAPTADFIADNLSPFRTIDVVSFTDLSHANALNPLGCVDYWYWSISPSTYSIVSNFPNGQNPKITFNDTGCYHITLISGYGNSRDTLTKQCYIKTTDYCLPSVTNLNNDLGISKVELSTIINFTSAGTVGYSDYAANYYTYLDEYMRYTISIHRSSAKNAMTRKVWIDFNIDGDFDDPGELVVQEASSTSVVFSDTFSVPPLPKYGSTRMRVGVCIAGYPNTACGPNFFGEYEDYRLILRPYSVAPELSLIGPDTILVMQCFGFTDPGATASSFLFGNLTNQIITTHNVDPNNAGFYTVNYKVSDPKGNTTIKQRTVLVVAELNPPIISLVGNAVDTVNVLSIYNDPGVTVSDSCSGIDRGEVTGNVFTNFLGKFTLIYTAYDKNQNTASLSRIVHVIDTEAPVIKLIGNVVDTVEVNTSYHDSGTVYTDNYDTNPVLLVTGSVNVSKIGVYDIKYEVSDSSGNTSVIYRTVYVLDLTAPQITSNYNNGDTIFINIFTSVYDKLSLSYSDNYNAVNELTIIPGGTYFTNFGYSEATVIGCYNLIHTVTDVSFNSTSVIYTVCVEDLEKPVITLLGSSVINIKQWETADTSDMKVDVTDNYDTDPTIWVSGSYYDDYLKNDKEGFYNVVYHAKDQSGNEADTIIRYINVLENISIEEDLNDQLVKLYPNPAKNTVYVSLNLKESDYAEICVMNQLGQCVFTNNHIDLKQQVHLISFEDIAAGMYMVRITTENQVIVKKLILTK